MNEFFIPAELLFVFVNRGLGKNIAAAAKRGGAVRITRIFSPTEEDNSFTGHKRHTDQDAIMVLLRDEAEAVIQAVIEETSKKNQYRDGMALVIDVTKVLRRSGTVTGCTDDSSDATEDKYMKSGFTMITSITNHGHAEELMAVAREAGAKCGTILDARGTCTEDDVKFLGISLAPEKEVLIIVSEDEKTPDILNVLSHHRDFKESGGGIIFTVDIAQYISLGECCSSK